MVTETWSHPLPTPTPVSQPFWDAAKQHRLSMQRCHDCEQMVFTPRELCPGCMSSDLDWVDLSGRGRVYTYTLIQQAAHPYFQDKVPYLYGVVLLDEGPRMFTNFLMDHDAIEIGQRVQAVFTDISDEYAIVQFEPAAE